MHARMLPDCFLLPAQLPNNAAIDRLPIAREAYHYRGELVPFPHLESLFHHRHSF